MISEKKIGRSTSSAASRIVSKIASGRVAVRRLAHCAVNRSRGAGNRWFGNVDGLVVVERRDLRDALLADFATDGKEERASAADLAPSSVEIDVDRQANRRQGAQSWNRSAGQRFLAPGQRDPHRAGNVAAVDIGAQKVEAVELPHPGFTRVEQDRRLASEPRLEGSGVGRCVRCPAPVVRGGATARREWVVLTAECVVTHQQLLTRAVRRLFRFPRSPRSSFAVTPTAHDGNRTTCPIFGRRLLTVPDALPTFHAG